MARRDLFTRGWVTGDRPTLFTRGWVVLDVDPPDPEEQTKEGAFRGRVSQTQSDRDFIVAFVMMSTETILKCHH